MRQHRHRASLVILFAIAAGAGTASADRGPKGQPTIDVSGNYTSNWGQVSLRQIGTKVVGTYVYQEGRLEGTLDGNMLRYTWREHDATGRGVWVVASNGELIGTWGVKDDDLSGGGWRLTQLTAERGRPPCTPTSATRSRHTSRCRR
jgi:hypothetical protein